MRIRPAVHACVWARVALLLALSLLSTARAAAAPGALDALLRQADAAYAARDVPARLAEAIARYGDAAALRQGDVSALLGLARSHAFRARAAPGEARDAWREVGRAAEGALAKVAPGFAQAIARGEPAGKAAAEVGPAGAEPLYYLGLAGMGMGRERGMAAVLAVKDEAMALVERAAALDERLDAGGPRRALGAWLAALPAVAGGGPTAARRELGRARQLFPDEPLTDVDEAQTLCVLLQDRDRFDALLRGVLDRDEARVPARAPEARLAKRLARDLLARRGVLF